MNPWGWGCVLICVGERRKKEGRLIWVWRKKKKAGRTGERARKKKAIT